MNWVRAKSSILLKMALKHLAEQMGRQKRVLLNRFKNYLASNQMPFTKEEDEMILRLVNQYGKQWVKIAQQLNSGRGSTNVSTRYHFIERHNFNLEEIHNQEFSLYLPLPGLPFPQQEVVASSLVIPTAQQNNQQLFTFNTFEEDKSQSEDEYLLQIDFAN